MSAQRSDLPRANSYNDRGVALAAQGSSDDAIAAFRAAIAACGSFAEAHNNLGIALAGAQQFEAAHASFLNAGRLDPHWPDPHNNCGAALRALGRPAPALKAFDRALALNSDYPEAHFNRGNALRDLHRADDAVLAYRAAISLRPAYFDARVNLAQVLQATGQIPEAIDAWRGLLKLQPTFAAGYHQLGRLLHQSRALSEAAIALRRVLIVAPNDALAQLDLGNVLFEQGKVDEAISAFHKAIALCPDLADAEYNLGNALSAAHRESDAIAAFRRAIEQKPDDARALNNLGNLLQVRGDLDEAISIFIAATQSSRPAAEHFSNLGNAMKEAGRIPEAIHCYDRAIELDPRNPTWASHRLYALHFHPNYPPERLLADHIAWDENYASGIAPIARRERPSTTAQRKLRIGYVSPDFREHVVGRNILPLIREHDRSQFEVFCYASQLRFDSITERFKSLSDGWRDIRPLADREAAEMIANDGIDILVDLSLHMAGNRLLVFAHRPAPVQITFAGYPGGTGLAAIDARLTDPYLDPPGESDAFYRERSIRLPHSFWCFEPSGDEPAVGPLPADANGFITFGCFNNFCKVNNATLLRWAAVLRAVPVSRLLLMVPRGTARAEVLRVMGSAAVEAGRVQFVERQSRAEYLALYNRIDIALDTLPYGGHTTSLEGMWMGVPLISRVGAQTVGRAGYSLLASLGLAELCGQDDRQMVGIAADLAADRPHLRNLRHSLRDRIAHSPLGDAVSFARGIEDAYRAVWGQLRGGKK